jgi:methylphosphotriester-DNA--protein-cysteine methyltransferase
MQLIASQELSEDENLWLKNLTDQLAAENLSALSRVIARAKDLQLDAYVNAIMRANLQSLKEVLAMGALTLEDVFMEFGYEELTQKWLQQGMDRGQEAKALEVAHKLLSKGIDAEIVADSTGISLDILRGQMIS